MKFAKKLYCFIYFVFTFFRCKSKSNFLSNTIMQRFELIMFDWILIICLLKITSGACYLGSGLSFTFRWKPQSLLFVKSLFKSHAAEFMSSTTEKESCHLRIVLNLQLNHQTSHWYRSEKIMVQEKILGDPYFNISPWRVLSI